MNEFEKKCRELGGEVSPIPCSWYNAWSKIYQDEPLLVDEEEEVYCCKPLK